MNLGINLKVIVPSLISPNPFFHSKIMPEYCSSPWADKFITCFKLKPRITTYILIKEYTNKHICEMYNPSSVVKREVFPSFSRKFLVFFLWLNKNKAYPFTSSLMSYMGSKVHSIHNP